MLQPEKYFCDMCGKEITRTRDFTNQIIPVVTDCEWEEGHRTETHVEGLKMDLCRDCYVKAFNIRCGYRGKNLEFISGVDE